MEVTGDGLGGGAGGDPKGRVLNGCPPGVTGHCTLNPMVKIP